MLKRFFAALPDIIILSILSGILVGFGVLFLSYHSYTIAIIIAILVVAIGAAIRELREGEP